MDTERTMPPAGPVPLPPRWQRADNIFADEPAAPPAEAGKPVRVDDGPASEQEPVFDAGRPDGPDADRDHESTPWTEQTLPIPFIGSSPLPVAGEDIEIPARERRSGRVRAVIRETLETVLLALLIFISVRSVIQNFKVEGSSMEPNLHSGQYLLVNKAAYFSIDPASLGVANLLPQDWQENPVIVYPFGSPSRGDVVVFRYPKDPRRDFIKRVIAVPGDTVEIRQGKVYVNGQVLHEPYIIENPMYSKEAQIVPPSQFYVLGDNRNNSSDSHVWGPVPHEYIIGKAWLSYWPLSEWGLAPNYTVAAEKVSAAN